MPSEYSSMRRTMSQVATPVLTQDSYPPKKPRDVPRMSLAATVHSKGALCSVVGTFSGGGLMLLAVSRSVVGA